MSKHERVVAAAKEHGWEFQLISVPGEGTGVELNRGPENLMIRWDLTGSLMHPLTYRVAGVRETKLRNVSAALKQMADKPNLTPARRRSSAAVEVDETPYLPLPFDTDADDATIIKALRGKTIVWRNRLLNTLESGQVPDRFQVKVKRDGVEKLVWRTSQNIYMTTSSAGRRIITFPAVGEQFRSVGLDQIVQIR